MTETEERLAYYENKKADMEEQYKQYMEEQYKQYMEEQYYENKKAEQEDLFKQSLEMYIVAIIDHIQKSHYEDVLKEMRQTYLKLAQMRRAYKSTFITKRDGGDEVYVKSGNLINHIDAVLSYFEDINKLIREGTVWPIQDT